MSNATIARASVSRTISSTPLRILDAPDIVDDYYLNLISWGHNNVGEPLALHGAVVLLLILGGGRLLLESVINRLCFSTRSDLVGGRNRKPLVKNLFLNIILWAVRFLFIYFSLTYIRCPVAILLVVTKDLPISPRFTPYELYRDANPALLQPIVEFYLLTC